MRTGNNGIELIKKYEGFAALSYICPAGYNTIGYGHVIREDENFYAGINDDIGEKLLRADLAIAESAVNKYIIANLSQNQFDALVSFVFNLGAGSLQRSTLRMKINRQEYESAGNEFEKWCFAGGRILKGLKERRLSEKALFLKPDVIDKPIRSSFWKFLGF